MKLETCFYSGLKIYPGHGKRVVRTDGRLHIFLNSKCERSFKMKRNPRKVCWTVLYRRKHKKGSQAEEISKKKTRRTQKFQRPIGTSTLAEILAKRNQKPEYRDAQRKQMIDAAKQQKQLASKTKKAEKAKAQTKQQVTKQKAPKQVKTQAPRVGGKR